MKRYELKYVIDPRNFLDLESVLLSHPACFREAYPDRIVNNIYFDNIDYKSGQSNLGGISDRTKVRYRWYGEESVSDNGAIEFKIKNNALGFKEYLKDIPYHNIDGLTDLVNKKLMSNHFQASLINQYKRKYYEDVSGRFRLTVDSGVNYMYPFSDMHISKGNAIRDERCIVEIKFDKADYQQLENISKYFPFRQMKHSKYVTGLFALYNS